MAKHIQCKIYNVNHIYIYSSTVLYTLMLLCYQLLEQYSSSPSEALNALKNNSSSPLPHQVTATIILLPISMSFTTLGTLYTWNQAGFICLF